MKKNIIALLVAIVLPIFTHATQPHSTTRGCYLNWQKHSLVLKHGEGRFKTSGKEYSLSDAQVDALLALLKSTDKSKMKNILATAMGFIRVKYALIYSER